jgi:hypothetical protein
MLYVLSNIYIYSYKVPQLVTKAKTTIMNLLTNAEIFATFNNNTIDAPPSITTSYGGIYN